MEKACPVVLRMRQHQCEVLAFRHPLAGLQFVKGTIEPGEALHAACVRELHEESGIVALPEKPLGECFVKAQGLTYGFYQMQVSQPIPNEFDFFCEDDGGHVFSFFWWPLAKTLDQEWHPIFHEIAAYLRSTIFDCGDGESYEL